MSDDHEARRVHSLIDAGVVAVPMRVDQNPRRASRLRRERGDGLANARDGWSKAGVDQQVAEKPVDQPGVRRSRGFAALAKRDLQFVERIVARLVQIEPHDRTCRDDVEAGIGD